MTNTVRAISIFLGISSNKTSHREKLISGLGGFIAIVLMLLVTQMFVAVNEAGFIVASMGASAVLLFAVPHGPLSQPWALGCGHLVSAVIGVSSYLLIPNLFIAAATAVGLAITAMYYLRCIHPPGGATALAAVITNANVHELGYWYVVTPVLCNISIIFAVAVIFNIFLPWRRYPEPMMQYTRPTAEHNNTGLDRLNREHIEDSSPKMNLYSKGEYDDLDRIYQLVEDEVTAPLSLDQIKRGLYYSNGVYGDNWSVRQVVDQPNSEQSCRDRLIYKVVAGKDRRSKGVISHEEFAQWAKYEVFLNENSWQLVADSHGTVQ